MATLPLTGVFNPVLCLAWACHGKSPLTRVCKWTTQPKQLYLLYTLVEIVLLLGRRGPISGVIGKNSNSCGYIKGSTLPLFLLFGSLSVVQMNYQRADNVWKGLLTAVEILQEAINAARFASLLLAFWSLLRCWQTRAEFLQPLQRLLANSKWHGKSNCPMLNVICKILWWPYSHLQPGKPGKFISSGYCSNLWERLVLHWALSKWCELITLHLAGYSSFVVSSRAWKHMPTQEYCLSHTKYLRQLGQTAPQWDWLAPLRFAHPVSFDLGRISWTSIWVWQLLQLELSGCQLHSYHSAAWWSPDAPRKSWLELPHSWSRTCEQSHSWFA